MQRQQTRSNAPIILIGASVLGLIGSITTNLLPLPMLSDPEAGSWEWVHEVWASDAVEASRKCYRAAEQALLTEFLPPPKKLTKRPSKYGEYRWECKMSSSDEDIPYVDPRNPRK